VASACGALAITPGAAAHAIAAFIQSTAVAIARPSISVSRLPPHPAALADRNTIRRCVHIGAYATHQRRDGAIIEVTRLLTPMGKSIQFVVLPTVVHHPAIQAYRIRVNERDLAHICGTEFPLYSQLSRFFLPWRMPADDRCSC
jgi:hypothetical protein